MLDSTTMISLKQLSLSQELIDMVVDYAHNNFNTLISCSLASRHFVQCSRYHLFERLRLSSSRLVDFFDVIESPISTITRVRIVRVDFDRRSHDFSSIITRLQILRPHSLSLTNMGREQTLDLDLDTAGFSDLKRLTITRSIFSELSLTIDMVSKLRALEHLCLFHAYFDCYTIKHSPADDHYLVGRSSPAPLLKTFELHFCNRIPEIFASIQTHLDVSALHTVAFSDVTSRRLATVGAFLRGLGPLLIHLELQLGADIITGKSRRYLILHGRDNLLLLSSTRTNREIY